MTLYTWLLLRHYKTETSSAMPHTFYQLGWDKYDKGVEGGGVGGYPEQRRNG